MTARYAEGMGVCDAVHGCWVLLCLLVELCTLPLKSRLVAERQVTLQKQLVSMKHHYTSNVILYVSANGTFPYTTVLMNIEKSTRAVTKVARQTANSRLRFSSKRRTCSPVDDHDQLSPQLESEPITQRLQQ
ncbi:hypothetical protein SCHPADRAFT_937194 [Schizopora paradoxa]|uniref:Uncharacterized protein n=1 Tax=Schizopora paradoxa TaxID=27342 RepID=A0A0H2S0C1_9AGAM|nr:hypothetical protein SCHPADRAFT_937194 [Schizopora paradoxa]